jgi:hypothetical protein
LSLKGSPKSFITHMAFFFLSKCQESPGYCPFILFLNPCEYGLGNQTRRQISGIIFITIIKNFLSS